MPPSYLCGGVSSDQHNLMAEPLTAAIAFFAKWGLGQVLSGILANAYPKDLFSRLLQVTTAWASNLPSDAHVVPTAILVTHYQSNEPYPEPIEVLAKLKNIQLPTADDWFACLRRHREWRRSVPPEPTEFFQLDSAQADPHLRELADLLAKECLREQPLAIGQVLANT